MATADTRTIKNYLSKLGKQDSKGRILFERILFDIEMSRNGLDILIERSDTEKLLKNFKSQIIKNLTGEFKGDVKRDEVMKTISGKKQKVVRLRYVDKGSIKYVDFDVERYPKEGKKGALPPKISEPATMLVLNAALASKGKVFKSEEDIFVNDVYGDLQKLYGKEWSHKLDEWIYTYFKQNQLFFANYSKATWAPFKHKDFKGQRDVQVFFKEHLKKLEKAPGVSAGTYEQWNPSDLYAVKRTELASLEKEITEANLKPDANTLLKLNTHLISLMEKNELVGISLKKIESGEIPKFKIFNVEKSKALSALKSFTALEKFTMKQINFEIRNLFATFPGKGGAPAATTYIFYGGTKTSDSKFAINITRSGDALVWNTSIPSSKGAQGGQSPKAEVIKLLSNQKSGVSFTNKYSDYPADDGKFYDILKNPNSSDYKLYHKWFDFCYNHPKNNYTKPVTFDQWADSVLEAYDHRAKVGKTKLALLNFWYDALKYHDKDPEFWTDLLYFGLKITAKGQFAPHAKIS